MEHALTINEMFSIEELAKAGLRQLDVPNISAKVFAKDDQVFFFDETNHDLYRLFSIINKRSFFL
ncbi:MAG: hypothetical protein JXR71_12530 [Bacteroidales bacterium]|nr:hypothetical protein [Bacteroidales bacterium]